METIKLILKWNGREFLPDVADLKKAKFELFFKHINNQIGVGGISRMPVAMGVGGL
jgi:hypothetical protein